MPTVTIGGETEFKRALRRIEELDGAGADTPLGLELAALNRPINEYRARLDGTSAASDSLSADVL